MKRSVIEALRDGLARAAERQAERDRSMHEREVICVSEGTFMDIRYACGCRSYKYVTFMHNGSPSDGGGGDYTLCEYHEGRG